MRVALLTTSAAALAWVCAFAKALAQEQSIGIVLMAASSFGSGGGIGGDISPTHHRSWWAPALEVAPLLVRVN
jgi:hypothetical protein